MMYARTVRPYTVAPLSALVVDKEDEVIIEQRCGWAWQGG